MINFILSLEFLFFCFGVISKYYSSGYSIILINNLLGTIIQISFLICLYSIVKESSFIIVSAIAFVQTIFTSLIIFSKKIPSLFNLPETLSITNNESQYYIHSIFSAIFVLTFLNGIWSIDNIKKTTLDKLKIFGVVFFIELLIHISMNYLISHTDEPNFPNFEIGRLTYLILFLFKLYAFLDFSKDDLIES